MWWWESLQLRLNEKIIVEENGLLTDDRHIFAGNLLLRKQFPNLQGLQDTHFSQWQKNLNIFMAKLSHMKCVFLRLIIFLISYKQLSKYNLLVMAIGVRTVKQVTWSGPIRRCSVSASRTVCLLVKSCLVMFSTKAKGCQRLWSLRFSKHISFS